MKKLILFILSILLTVALVIPVLAHSGKTDSNGGHTDRSTGKYHYHHGYPAHDHWDMDGDGDLDCPYEFKDTTNKNDSSSSKNNESSSATTNKSSNFSSYLDAYRKSQQNSWVSTETEVEKEEKPTSIQKDDDMRKEGLFMNDWESVIAVLIFAALFFATLGWNDIVDRVQTLRIIRRYLPAVDRQDIGVSFWLRIIPLGISTFILFILFDSNLIETISYVIFTIDWVNENFSFDGVNNAVSLIITSVLVFLPLLLGNIWVAHRRMNILIEKAQDNHMPLFDYAKSISSETAINHIEEYLDRPHLIRTYVDMYTKSGQISCQCAEVLKSVYCNDTKYFRKLKRQRLTFRILGFSIILMLSVLAIFVYIVLPFL